MPRPDGTDGSDHKYRQVIHDRYKKRAQNKKLVTVLTYASAPANILRMLWHMVPVFIQVGGATNMTYIIAAALSVSIFLQLNGLSTKPQPSHKVLMVSNIIMVIAWAVGFMIFWQYHTLANKSVLYPEVLANYLMMKQGIAYKTSKPILATIESVIDAYFICAVGACVFFTYQYVMDISGKNDKMGGTNWNPRMISTSAKEEMVNPAAIEGKKGR